MKRIVCEKGAEGEKETNYYDAQTCHKMSVTGEYYD